MYHIKEISAWRRKHSHVVFVCFICIFLSMLILFVTFVKIQNLYVKVLLKLSFSLIFPNKTNLLINIVSFRRAAFIFRKHMKKLVDISRKRIRYISSKKIYMAFEATLKFMADSNNTPQKWRKRNVSRKIAGNFS